MPPANNRSKIIRYTALGVLVTSSVVAANTEDVHLRKTMIVLTLVCWAVCEALSFVVPRRTERKADSRPRHDGRVVRAAIAQGEPSASLLIEEPFDERHCSASITNDGAVARRSDVL